MSGTVYVLCSILDNVHALTDNLQGTSGTALHLLVLIHVVRPIQNRTIIIVNGGDIGADRVSGGGVTPPTFDRPQS